MSGITLTKIAAASIPTPAANKVTIFDETTTGEPSYKNDAGTVISLKGTNGAAGASGGSAQLASIAAASAAIANTETVVVSASLAANYMTAGMSFRIRGAGVGTTGLTPGVDTFRIRIGTTTLTGNIPTSVAPAANASVTAQAFSFEALVTVRTAGAGGTIIGECLAVGDDIATGLFTTLVDLSATVATVAVDTTATKLLELTFQSATAGSSCTFHVATIEVLNSGAAGGSAPNSYENVLTAPVTCVNANTFYSGPAVTPAAGSYELYAEAECSSANAASTGITIRIYDGSGALVARNAYSSGGAGGGVLVSCRARVTSAGSTTYTLQVASVRGSSDTVILDTAANNGTTDKCTSIVAIAVTAL